MKKILLTSGLFLGLIACSSNVDGPAPDDGDTQLTGDGDGDVSQDEDQQATDTTPGDNDSSQTCPAPALTANQIEVYGEGEGDGWISGGFTSSVSTETSNVCSGSQALKYVSHHFDGIYFVHSADLPANHLSVRVYVSDDTNFTIAAVPNGGDGHCYRLPYPTTCGENGPCGPDQHAAPCILQWSAGWNAVELDIPASTGTVAKVFFERQDLGPETVTLIVDDLRLTQP